MDKREQIGPWKAWVQFLGNNDVIMAFWAVIGLICAATAPCIVIKDSVDKALFSVYTFLLVSILYIFAWSIRETSFMRERRGWKVSSGWNGIVTVGTSLIAANHVVSVLWIHFWLLVAVSVFVLMELGKPIFDFGIGLFFLRLPLQLTMGQFKMRYSAYYLLVGAVLLFCHIWQPYYLGVFNKYVRDEKKKEEEEEKKEKEEKKRKEEKGKEDRTRNDGVQPTGIDFVSEAGQRDDAKKSHKKNIFEKEE